MIDYDWRAEISTEDGPMRGGPAATIAPMCGICGYGIMGRKYGPDPLRLPRVPAWPGAGPNKPSPCTGVPACACIGGKGCLGR